MIRQGLIQEANVTIGAHLDTGYYVILRTGCIIGDEVKIWSHTVIDPGARIGNNVKIHCNCYISQGVIIEDDVFIGPNVIFLNDKYPPRYEPDLWTPPIVRKGAIIGGGCIIGPGVEIGERAIIGAGAVVIKSVPAHQLWVGLPASRLK